MTCSFSHKIPVYFFENQNQLNILLLVLESSLKLANYDLSFLTQVLRISNGQSEKQSTICFCFLAAMTFISYISRHVQKFSC